jgi:hypothetical protein
MIMLHLTLSLLGVTYKCDQFRPRSESVLILKKIPRNYFDIFHKKWFGNFLEILEK